MASNAAAILLMTQCSRSSSGGGWGGGDPDFDPIGAFLIGMTIALVAIGLSIPIGLILFGHKVG